MAAAAAAVVAAQQKRARDRIVSHLRGCTAFDAHSASPLPLRERSERQMLKYLVSVGAVVAASDDRYFLDEEALKADEKRRARRAMITLIVVFGLLVFVFALVALVHFLRG